MQPTTEPAVSPKDLERLRSLAKKQLEFANSEKNAVILRKWEALGAGRRESPTVRLLFSNFPDEVVAPRMECEGDAARGIEWGLLSTLVGRELFDDDTPISPTYDVGLSAGAHPFGIGANITRSPHGKGFHINPVIENLDEE